MLGKVSLSKKHEYFYKLWNGEQLKKTLIAMDTETTVVEEEEKTADIVPVTF